MSGKFFNTPYHQICFGQSCQVHLDAMKDMIYERLYASEYDLDIARIATSTEQKQQFLNISAAEAQQARQLANAYFIISGAWPEIPAPIVAIADYPDALRERIEALKVSTARYSQFGRSNTDYCLAALCNDIAAQDRDHILRVMDALAQWARG